MRVSPLVLLLLASTASAQDRHSARDPDGMDRIVMTAGGVATSVGTVALAFGDAPDWPAALAPFVSGGVVYGIGEWRGLDGGLLETMGGAVLGGAIGGGVMLLATQTDDTNREATYLLVGGVLYLTLPSAFAVAGYTIHATPWIDRSYDSEPLPTLSLRLTL